MPLTARRRSTSHRTTNCMKIWIYLINNFAHDLFTGLWFGSFIVVYVLHGKISQTEQPALLAELLKLFFQVGAGSLVLVVLTGIIRFAYRRDWDRLEGMKEKKRSALIIKHALLGSAFLLGSICAYQWVY